MKDRKEKNQRIDSDFSLGLERNFFLSLQFPYDVIICQRGGHSGPCGPGDRTRYLFIMKLRAKGGAPDQALEAMAVVVVVVVVVAADIRLRVAAPRKSQGR